MAVPTTFKNWRYKLYDQILAADAANIDVTAIPATFKDLELEFVGRSDVAAALDSLSVAFNGDATDANYDDERVNATGTATASASEVRAASGSRQFGLITGASAPAGYPGIIRAWIPEYAGTTWAKEAHIFSYAWGSRATGGQTFRGTGLGWNNTAAINQITFTPAAGTVFKAGSRLTIYALA